MDNERLEEKQKLLFKCGTKIIPAQVDKICYKVDIQTGEQIDTCIGEKNDLAVKKYREHFATKGLFENTVYEGIPQLLQALKEKGFELIVATSKPEQYSVQILDHFDLSKYFDFICGSNMDESRSKKEEVIEYALGLANNKNKETILMIGDREYDIIGAQKNNIKSCGVLFGYGSKEEHQNAGADYICETVKDLQDLLLG